MSGQPNIIVDAKGAIVNQLGQDDPRAFHLSLLWFKNAGGVKGIYLMEKLEAELMDFAKDPTLGKDQLPPRPEMPDTSQMAEAQKREAEDIYWKLMEQYNTALVALEAQIPMPDWYAIRRYMRPLERARDSTPAIKGGRWKSLTKGEVDDPKQGLFGGMGGGNRR